MALVAHVALVAIFRTYVQMFKPKNALDMLGSLYSWEEEELWKTTGLSNVRKI